MLVGVSVSVSANANANANVNASVSASANASDSDSHTDIDSVVSLGLLACLLHMISACIVKLLLTSVDCSMRVAAPSTGDR